MSKIGAVIVAAGKGTRMGTDIPKQFLMLGDKPILLHTVLAFDNCNQINEIVVVTGKENTELTKDILKNIKKPLSVVAGGSERQNSVYNGLCALSEDVEYVLIHDGVRPFIENKYIVRIIEDVKKYHACIMGVKTKDTIKICDENGVIKDTPPRSSLWNALTPQAFRLELIKSAYEKIISDGISITDDAMAAEYIGIKPKMTEGSYKNIKITTPEDLNTVKTFF